MIEIQGMFGTFERPLKASMFKHNTPYIRVQCISNAKAEDGNYKTDRPHVFDEFGPTVFVLERSHAIFLRNIYNTHSALNF